MAQQSHHVCSVYDSLDLVYFCKPYYSIGHIDNVEPHPHVVAPGGCIQQTPLENRAGLS